MPNRVTKRLGEALDRRSAVLAGILHRLDRERMIDKAHAMGVALCRDLIDAAGFAPPRWSRSRRTGMTS